MGDDGDDDWAAWFEVILLCMSVAMNIDWLCNIYKMFEEMTINSIWICVILLLLCCLNNFRLMELQSYSLNGQRADKPPAIPLND